MSSRERKHSLRVIKCGVAPCSCVVTLLARLREARSDMVWVRGLLEVWQMARYALLGSAGKLSAHVALCTLHRFVRAGEWESGVGVVEGGVEP